MKFVAGNLALDFVNTVGGRRGRRVLADKINRESDLRRWADLAGLNAIRAISPAVVRRAIALRESLYGVFTAAMRRRRPAARDIRIFRRELAIARLHERFDLSPGSFGWSWNSRRAPDRVVWEVARSAADLLASEELTRLRQCAGDECGWLFLDSSRNRSRRWCDMKDCGNLAKARRFRRKSRRKSYAGERIP